MNTKNISLTVLFLTLMSPFGFAGPEPISSDKKAVVSTPEVREGCNWTGFYIGGNIGGAFDRADIDLNLTGEWEIFREPSDETFGQHLGSRNLNANGLVAGGFVGYNYQWNHWLLGGEANVDYVGLRDSFNSGVQFVNPGSGDEIIVRQSFKTHYRATLGPRFGYAWNRLLFYITGGLAIGDIDFSQRVSEPEEAFREEGSTNDTQIGWMVGGGLQYCITDHWSVRADYRYTDLECADFSSVATDPIFTGHHEACVTFHSVTAGISYKF
ncbi:MAG: outer membrane beta-barrel protein [Verrucomicrobiota bacterium]